MDEDSDLDKDLDNSLMDPHHGLDSSTEDGENPDDTLADNGEHKEDAATASASAPANLNQEHVSMLEEMVLEMKQGFHAALQELAKIQDKDNDGAGYSKHLQQQQQRQLDDLKDTVVGIKDQLTSLVKVVEQVQDENKQLKEDCQVLQAQVRREGLGPDDDMIIPVNASLEWTEEGTQNPFENDDLHHSSDEIDERKTGDHKAEDNDEVTAIACKSLSLTQALGEKYLEFNMSASSEDGEESSCRRRQSSMAPKSCALNEDSSRRHSMPASNLFNVQNKQTARAAQRRAAVEELADSQRDYCSQVWALLDTYLTPLQTSNYLTGEQLELLFPPFLERLYMEHCMICSGLQDKLVHWSYMGSIANLLSRITESHNADSLLSLYQEYAEYLPDAITCLRDALIHSADFKSFLKTIQQSSCQTDDLMTLIIAPVQHLPKYLLQLQQICKHTPSTHPDYLLLQTSLGRLRGFVEQVNDHVVSAMTVLSQDSRIGSSNDSSQVLSARDSGVHSNEEEMTTARNFFRSEQNLSPVDWQEDMYYSPRGPPRLKSNSFYHDQWHRVEEQRKLSSHLIALSQPDLTRFDMMGGLSVFNPNGHQYNPNVPRSQSGLPPSGTKQSWGNSRGGNGGHRKFKLRPHHGSPNAFPAADNSRLIPSPHSRPSSAIDFTSSYPHHFQSQHLHDFSQPPTRPRSAMAPLDPHHRPTIISRKHGRRSQPPVSNSSYWSENSSSFQQKHPQSKMTVPPLDLLPSRPSPLPNHTSLEDDDEDDTRASDSPSFVTSGDSHRHSSSHCSRDDREFDHDFRQVLSESEPDHGQDPRTSEFSEEDVAASLAWKLCADSNGKGTTGPFNEGHDLKASLRSHLHDRNGAFLHSNGATASESKTFELSRISGERNGSGLNTKKANSTSSESRRNLPSQSVKTSNSNKSSDNGDNNVIISSEELSVFSESSKAMTGSTFEEPATEDYNTITSNISNKNASSDFKPIEERIIKNTENTVVSKVDETGQQQISKNSESSDGGKNMIEHNRQFLLSLAQIPKRSQNSEPAGSKKKSVFSSTAIISLKNCTTEGSDKKIETTFSANGLSSDESEGKNSASGAPTSVSRDKIIRRSMPPVSSHLTNGFHGLEDKTMIRTSSPNELHKDLPKSTSDTDKRDNSVSSSSKTTDKLRGGNANNVLETVIDDNTNSNNDKEVHHRDHNNRVDARLTRSLDMSELFISDDNKERRRDRKKIKESSGAYHPTDSLPKANDDPVAARKKMHLKSSFKNLFSKKSKN